MPACWYVLMRFFLRVDGTLVRLRDVRLFCDLRQSDKVHSSPSAERCNDRILQQVL